MKKIEEITGIISKEEYLKLFSTILGLLGNTTKVKILFGFAWGNEYKNWEEIDTEIKDIWKYVKEAESLGNGKLSKDDLFLKINDNIEILFCHESDIHLSYNVKDGLIEMIKNKIVFEHLRSN